MDCKFILLMLIAISLQIPNGETAKILGLFTTFSKSHLIVHMEVIKPLIERGHNVTIVTSLDLNDPNANVRYKHVKLQTEFKPTDFISKMMKMTPFEKFLNFFTFFQKMALFSKNTLKSDEMKKVLDKESFDLVLIGLFVNEFEIGVAAHFKCPAVIIWLAQPPYIVNSLVGNPDLVSHVPNIFLSGKKQFTFMDRLKNFGMYLMERVIAWNYERNQREIYNELFPYDKYPSFEEAKKNVSLVLANYHFSEGIIRANVPAMVEIGGIQAEESPKPLPEDLQKHLDSAGKDGAIYFSLGSNARSSELNKNTIQIIYNVLSKLKQKVVWKWETDEYPGQSKNILYKKWFPQNSVLAHPNMKLFITHGGKGSVIESEFYGVPMIGLPIFAEQPANVQKFMLQGHGLGLDFQQLTEKDFKEAITEILTNKTYSKNVKYHSSLYRDRPMKAKETAAYWIEYVLRHNGAKHMRSLAADMYTYELIGIDVLAFFAVILYVIFKIIKISFKYLWKKCCSRGSKDKKSVKNLDKKKN